LWLNDIWGYKNVVDSVASLDQRLSLCFKHGRAFAIQKIPDLLVTLFLGVSLTGYGAAY